MLMVVLGDFFLRYTTSSIMLRSTIPFVGLVTLLLYDGCSVRNTRLAGI